MADALDRYNAKRDFSRTGEPKGAAAKKRKPAALSFVIQKHAATRLHYDLRLELDGVLLSWAVTRGPSLVPGEKRLAVHVEDHPLDYASFEGRIPDGNYGAGEVIVWDRGTWEPVADPHKGLEKGHLDFRLSGEKLSGEWHLVRLRARAGEKRDNWLLIKASDEAARPEGSPEITEEHPQSVITGKRVEDLAPAGSKQAGKKPAAGKPAAAASKAATQASKPARTRPAAAHAPASSRAPRKAPAAVAKKAKDTKDEPEGSRSAPRPKRASRDASLPEPPEFVQPCLAELATTTPSGARWLHEIKFDGYRIQARLSAGTLTLRTRSGLDWTDRFVPSAFAGELAELGIRNALIDGEVVVEDSGGVSDFSALQADLSEGRRDRMVFWAFDLLFLDGEDLAGRPLAERKAALAGLIPEPRALRYSEDMDEGGEALLRHACRLSLEGIVSKRRDAPYRSGRGGEWVKTKCSRRQEFVIGGYTPSSASPGAVGSLVLGTWHKDALRLDGRVGSGFSAAASRSLWKELEALRTEAPPFAGPLPAEARRGVRWAKPELVAEVEFRSRTASDTLRHAVFHGLRRDKPAREVVREEPSAPPSGAGAQGEATTSVPLTHPDRMFWPEAGVTKQGLLDFYSAIWPYIGPHIVERPLSLLRCPGGVTEECFFQKHAWNGMDARVSTGTDAEGEQFLFIRDFDGLAALVQAGVLEIHPWGSHVASVEKPDIVTFDLDPGPGVSWNEVIEAAFGVKAHLEDRGLASYVKTSGGKGLHVVVPLRPSAGWDDVKAFAKGVAEGLAREAPARLTAVLSKSARSGKIFVDYLRNGRGATAVAAYSTRARETAGVSTPVSWDELGPALTPDRFRIGNLLNRLDHLGKDPWQGFFEASQKLPSPGKTRTGWRKAARKPGA
jgi:bifunctional non-homologous end joining protein LigD